MVRQKIIVLIVTLTVFAAPAFVVGQESAQSEPKNTSLFGQLDQFGKKLWNGIIPGKSADETEKTSPPEGGRFSRGPMQDGFDAGRTGSVLDAARNDAAVGKTVKAVPTTGNYPEGNGKSTLMASRPATEKTAVAAKVERPQNQPQYRPPVEQTSTDTRPLHERLSGLSQSPFTAQTKPAAANQTPAVRPSPAQTPDFQSNKNVAAAANRAVERPAPGPMRQALISKQPAYASHPKATPKPPVPDMNDAAKPVQTKQSPQPAANTAAKTSAVGNVLIEAEAVGRGEGDVLFERHSPMLNVRTRGPRHITVDKESIYTVFIDNLGKAEAADVAVAIELPEWADVLGAKPSRGATRSLPATDGHKQFDWQVGALAAGGSEQIALRIVPRESRAIDLGVSWTFKPAVSQTVIEVQEPKLEMRLIGPREVAYGKNQKYQLEIANNGNGPAEAVAITLMPVSAAAGLPSTHSLGAFPAGKKIALEIALTPRQKDGLAVRVDLHNEGKMCARLDEKILVRKAELEMIADGPNMQYVGTVATYRIRLRNTGNADAKNVKVAAKIPAQAKYLAAEDGGKLIEADGRAVWTLDAIPAQSEKIIELKCELVQAGFNRIDVETTADDQIQVSTAAGTNVEAMADLTLEVVDPTGPVPVGKDAVYQIRIRNRGSKQAEGVEAVAYFSQGIEPVSVSGAEHTLGPGQVFFRGIDTIEAGKEVLLKITARADAPGNHMFRAEVHCKPLDTKLVSEETTLFFNGTLIADRPAVNQQTVNLPEAASQDAVKPTILQESRSADNRNLWGVDPAPSQSPQPVSNDRQTPTVAPRYRSQLR